MSSETFPPELELARGQIEFARSYTRSLLEGLPDDQWFCQPPGCPTHIAWQVGHLAMAQYMLTLFRLRGKTPDDAEVIPKPFLKRFVRGSQPEPDPAKNLPPAEIRATFDGVYQQLLVEWPQIDPAILSTRVLEPYAVEDTVLGSLYFCAAHEMLHAGQIGLIRRLLGHEPVR